MSSNTTIYTGFWTNYSKGSTLGSTLTLSNRNGSILIAALAVFIQLIAGRSWGIICFITHQVRATTKAKHVMHHQQQATLRNNTSDFSTLWNFALISWAWRKHSLGNLPKTITIIVIGVLHLVAFGAAGILSSRMTSAGKEVLISSSPTCGFWGVNTRTNETFQNGVAWESYTRLFLEASEQYVQNCLTQSQSLPECNIFKRQQLNWVSTSVPCPFEDLCSGPPNGAFQMDSKLLDSRDDLGINSEDKDRIQLRKVTTCSPIKTEGYLKNGTGGVNYRNGIYQGYNNMNYTAVYYGPNVYNFSSFVMTELDLQNATYIHTNFRDIAGPLYNDEKPPYDLHAEASDTSMGVGSFSPIPALSVPNGTLTLFFASFYGAFQQPSEDLWLSAHIPHIVNSFDKDTGAKIATTTSYATDNAISPLGCLDQYQVCNPSRNSSEKCTPLLSSNQIWYDPTGDLHNIFDTDRQMAIANNTMRLFAFAAQNNILRISSPLLAFSLSSGLTSLTPAPNQWILEMSNLFTISLAGLQRFLMGFMTGPPAQFTQFVTPNMTNTDPVLAWLCGSQIIKRADYTNFQTFSVSLIFGIGLIIIVTSLALERTVGWVRLRWRSGRWRQRAWWAEGTLQLQRRAFEGMGITNWEVGEWDRVPITDKGTVFSALRNWDEMLPTIARYTVEMKPKATSTSAENSNNVVPQAESNLSSTTEESINLQRIRPNSI